MSDDQNNDCSKEPSKNIYSEKADTDNSDGLTVTHQSKLPISNDKKMDSPKNKSNRANDKASDHIIDKQPEVREINGFENKHEPTTHGDWSINGRCFDF